MGSFRRKAGEVEWHWCPGCPGWPESEFENIDFNDAPPVGQLCDECRHRERAERCI